MKVLVANRSEIAIRVLRACRDLGIPSVAVYSEADKDAPHVHYADEAVHIGPAPAAESYLKIPKVIAVARDSGATAIHPGYGFLSENPEFARAVEEVGLIFIGPRPQTMALVGNKLSGCRAAHQAGLPVLSGTNEPLDEKLSSDLGENVQFPILVKAVAGGGGRGIRVAATASELDSMISLARREALAAFGDGSVYLEPLIQQARHIEVQILGDGRGNILCLGERECSIQRRHQKLIEESPAHGLPPDLRERIFKAAVHLARSLNYRSLGTVEFLLDRDNNFYFIEVNPRIQVEHPVTEMVTGLDLVKEQIRTAQGRPLRYTQEQIKSSGAAIEARVLAEDPAQDFAPDTGEITYLKEPGGPGIRVDSALYTGMQVTTNYDSMLAKVIAWGENRAVAIMRLRRALREFQIGGINTDLEFLFQIVDSSAFQAGNIDTTYLDTFQPRDKSDEELLDQEIAVAAALKAHRQRMIPETEENGIQNHWQMTAWREQM